MDFSKLSGSARTAAILAVVVVVTGIVSVINDWGGLMLLAAAGGVLVLGVLLGPQLAPATKLPGSNGTLMLIGAGLAAVVWVITAISWLDWIVRHLATFDVLQFLVGLVASIFLALIAWRAVQAEGGKLSFGSAEAPAAAPAAAPATSVAPAASAASAAPAAPDEDPE